MNLIRSKVHSLHSIKQNKLALSYKDDKRFINGDGITTLAHGHWSLMNLDLFNELRKQLNSATGTNNSIQQQERTTQLGNMNETTQLSSRNETTQLVSSNETTQLCTAVDRLQPPATACTAFTAESAFSTY
ncbi:hypothetical protein TNCV_2673901 [Trichonephila clavipes]|nr:hypothetical protein TNCV_2673901 [Trichonephila clavipes]